MASLTVRFGDETIGTYPIASHPFVVGRDMTNDVTIDNAGVSRAHCRFVWDGKHWFVEDMDSANGTFHRGRKVRKASLAARDEVLIGKHMLVFSYVPGEAPPRTKGGDPIGADDMRRAEKSSASDNLLTFKMDARQLQARLAQKEKEPDQPMRAADLARSFESLAESHGSRVTPFGSPVTKRLPPSEGGSFLGIMIKVLAVAALLAVLAAAGLYVLDMLGFIGR